MTEKIPNCKCFLIGFLPQSSHCFMKNKTENQDLWYFSSSASYSKNFTTVLKCADSNFFSAFQLILKHSTDTRTIMLPAKNSPSCNPTQPKPRGLPRRWTTFQDEYPWVVKKQNKLWQITVLSSVLQTLWKEVRKDPPAGLHQQEAMGKDALGPKQQTLEQAASPEKGQRRLRYEFNNQHTLFLCKHTLFTMQQTAPRTAAHKTSERI